MITAGQESAAFHTGNLRHSLDAGWMDAFTLCYTD